MSDISATRGRIDTKFYLYRKNVCRRAPSPSWTHRPLQDGRRGKLKTQKMGGGLIRAADSYHFYFLSASKCASICRAETCAHSTVEPSRSAKAFLHGWPKSLKKFRIFHHFESLRPYISETITRAQLLPRMADRTRAVKTTLFTSALRRIFSNR